MHHDDEYLPAAKLPNRSKLLLWLVIIMVLVVLIALGVTMLQAEEKLVVCTPPYIGAEECAESCNGTCNATLFANNKPVCFECQEPEEEPAPMAAESCPNGLLSDMEACNNGCTNGSCIEYSQAGTNSCYICVQCARGTFGTKEACDTQCGSECVISGQKQGAQCFSCPQ